MAEPVVRVENLSKKYYIGITSKQTQTLLVSRLADMFLSPLRRLVDSRLARSGADDVAEMWALRDVSFELQQGEVLGIIGQNGSGKSTLLKIISHITAPTQGRVTLRGRIGSLLEVGIGFHPELTGRENVYLSGAIQGMKRSYIDRIFDEIVDFSGVERYIDTPVKYYSSGMYVRLAFSVAASLDPEILILDEVLAVGDAEFQRKSLEKMENAAKSGKTVLFVSHGLSLVMRLCNQGIYLENGEVLFGGTAKDTVSYYLKKLHKIDDDRIKSETSDSLLPYMDLRESNKRWEGYKQKIISWVSTHKLDGTPCTEFNTGDSMLIRIGYHVDEELNAGCYIMILDYTGSRVVFIRNTHNNVPLKLNGDGHIECVMHDIRLIEGSYTLMINIDENLKWLDCVGDTIHFKVSTGNYLGGETINQGEVSFAQRSEWRVAPG